MRVSGQRHVLAILPLGTRTVAHGRGGCLGPRTVWTDAQNRAPTPNGILSQHRPARSDSLHRLRHPGILRFYFYFYLPIFVAVHVQM